MGGLKRLPRKDPQQWYNVSPSSTNLAVYDIRLVLPPLIVKSVTASGSPLYDRPGFLHLLSSVMSPTASALARTLNTSIAATGMASIPTQQSTPTGDIRNQYDRSFFRQQYHRRNQDF